MSSSLELPIMHEKIEVFTRDQQLKSDAVLLSAGFFSRVWVTRRTVAFGLALVCCLL